MVVWEDGAMKKSDYRKFQIKTVTGNDDFASMREVIQRRYKRLQDSKEPFPSLVLIDGGLGQLHAAYAALEEIGVTLQPLASIAKRKRLSTSTARRTTPSSSTAAARSYTWCRRFVMNPTVSPSPTTASAARSATAKPSSTPFPA